MYSLKSGKGEILTIEFPTISRVSTAWGCILQYLSVVADIIAGSNYSTNDDTWWYSFTLAFIVVPGFINCFVQSCTYYRKPINNPQDSRVGEKPVLFKRRTWSRKKKVLLCIVNLLTLRTLFETLASFKWNFQTGAWRDARVLHVIFSSFPQILLQAYIIFRQWNEDVQFSFWPTILSISLAMLNVCFVPIETPCCEDSRKLTLVSITS